jgi:hypothetical protein
MLSQVAAERYFERVLAWLRTRDKEPRKWQTAADLSDFFLYLTAEELRTLLRRMQQLLEPFLRRNQDPALRPPASRSVALIRLAFPMSYESLLPQTKRKVARRGRPH